MVVNIFYYNGEFKSSFLTADYEADNVMSKIMKSGIKIEDRVRFLISFSIRELFNNSVEHGNNFDENKLVKYSIIMSLDDFEISVSDDGGGFDLGAVLEREKNDTNMRERNRGLIAVISMGFDLKMFSGSIIAKFNFEKKIVTGERTGYTMDIKIESNVAFCIVNKALIAPNIKELVEILKKDLKDEDSFSTVIFDLTESSSIDSMGITFLVGAYKTYSAKGKDVKLVGVPAAMNELFKIMKLEDVFKIEVVK
jgi:anti-anti-sigma factor